VSVTTTSGSVGDVKKAVHEAQQKALTLKLKGGQKTPTAGNYDWVSILDTVEKRLGGTTLVPTSDLKNTKEDVAVIYEKLLEAPTTSTVQQLFGKVIQWTLPKSDLTLEQDVKWTKKFRDFISNPYTNLEDNKEKFFVDYYLFVAEVGIRECFDQKVDGNTVTKSGWLLLHTSVFGCLEEVFGAKKAAVKNEECLRSLVNTPGKSFTWICFDPVSPELVRSAYHVVVSLYLYGEESLYNPKTKTHSEFRKETLLYVRYSDKDDKEGKSFEWYE